MDKRSKKLVILLGMNKPSKGMPMDMQQTSKEAKNKNSKTGKKKTSKKGGKSKC